MSQLTTSPPGPTRTYSYKARDNTGKVITGSIAAASEGEVGARLRAEGKYVLAVYDKPVHEGTALDPEQIRRNESAKRIRREDVIAFCQQMSVMLDTGVPLSEALDAFCRQTSRREFQQVLAVLRDDIYAGEQFSTAMAKWPRVFPTMMVSLMKASEASGTLAMMLGRIAEYLTKERRTQKQVKGALSYPVFMTSAGVVMTVFLMVFILPRFASIYGQRGAILPTPTKILLAMSEFVTGWYMYYLPVLIVVGTFMFFWVRKPSGRKVLDWLRLKTPILRTVFSQLYITRATRTMGTLMHAGVNVLDIIEICRGVTSNIYYDELWTSAESHIRDGGQLSEVMMKSHLIPPNIASMVSSGERSGKLSDVMEKIAAFSEEELDNAVKQATGYIEPIAIICMGVIVGGVAMALLLPIFKMGNVVAGG
jgi:type IV pilus assembly protein PilC